MKQLCFVCQSHKTQQIDFIGLSSARHDPKKHKEAKVICYVEQNHPQQNFGADKIIGLIIVSM